MNNGALIQVSAQTKMALGAMLATFGVMGIVLSVLLEWSEAAGPWAFLLGFVTGVVTGLGATLSVAGLIARRRGG
jgi:predicted ABC-type sugar transport system permease subunit